MSLRIERATVDDLEKLYSVEKECFTHEAFSKEEIASLLQRPNSISLLAKTKDEVAGFIIALIYERENQKIGHILTIDVAIKARKRGVGLRLLKKLEQELREKGAEACYLEVKVDNVAARRLYKKLGYSEIRFMKDFYRSGGDCIVMKKSFQ